MAYRSLLTALLFTTALLYGCAGAPKERIVVEKVYVPVVAEVPASIKAYKLPDKPKFIAPSDSKAVVGLDKENTLKTQTMIHSLVTRVCQLEAYLNLKNCRAR